MYCSVQEYGSINSHPGATGIWSAVSKIGLSSSITGISSICEKSKIGKSKVRAVRVNFIVNVSLIIGENNGDFTGQLPWFSITLFWNCKFQLLYNVKRCFVRGLCSLVFYFRVFIYIKSSTRTY